MSGRLDKTYSMEESQRGQGDREDQRSLGNGKHARSQSPLKFFAEAKKNINDVFKDIAEYVKESHAFLNALPEECQCDKAKSVEEFGKTIQKIIEVLTRNHMKVVFFGRTSNGKSTTINAMLRNNIMPSGIGHTTHCFIQVEGCDSSDGFLLTEDSDQKKSISDINQLASALSKVKLKENSLIRIFWPKQKCKFLREDVVFLDSPGIDVTPDLDDWIDKHCLDADVFVLVANAESTLMQTEKNFFHKVSNRLSKPNIFILQNRWDISVGEEKVEQVKEQHYQRNVEFLADQLKVVDRQEAKNRIFFVSAKETLVSRLHEDNKTPIPHGSLQGNYQERALAFANFETAFEICISKSAVKTKFENHSQKGRNIMSSLKSIMEEIYQKCQLQGEKLQEVKGKKASELDNLEKQTLKLNTEMKDKIKANVEEVEREVSNAMNKEINHLSVLVEDFKRTFHPDEEKLRDYKKELHAYVEDGIKINLTGRQFVRAVQTVEMHMRDGLTDPLPKETEQYLDIPKNQFENAFRLLCADFQEDIQFRFSFGITALMERFLGPKGVRTVLTGNGNTIPRPIPGRAQDNQILVGVMTTFASVSSRTTMGALIIGGMVAKVTDWRIIALVGALYGMLYLYERMSWTNKAKERTFKKQYVDYVTSKLKLIVDLTSATCSQQVQQGLTSTFAGLCKKVEKSKQDLENEIMELDKEITKQREEIGLKGKTLRNKADYLDKTLDGFIKKFLGQKDS
ncbi:mitofusin-2-like [Crassostrea virginica]